MYEDGRVGSVGYYDDAYPDYRYGYPIYGGAYPYHYPYRSHHPFPRHSHAPARTAPVNPGIAVGAPDYRGVQSMPPRPAGVQPRR